MDELFTAIFVIALLLIHAVALGGAFLRATHWVVRDGWTFTALLLGQGFALFGAEIFLLGEAHVLYRDVIYLSTAIMLGLIAWSRPWQLLSPLPEDVSSTPPGRKRRMIMWVSAAMVLAAVVGACRHQPLDLDDVTYHWSAPLIWANSNGWVDTPYRLTDGPTLAEMMFTVPALFGSYLGAHFLTIVFLVLLAASCASLARAIGADALAAALGVLCVPTILMFSPVSHNDNITAAFALCAYAALFNASPKPPSSRAIIAATIALAAAISTKPYMLLAAPGIGAYVLYTGFRRGADRSARARSVVHLCGVGAALALTFAVWMGHCYRLSGRLWDTRGYYIAQSPSDPLWDSPWASGRKPRLVDYLETPIVFPLRMTIGHDDLVHGYRIGPMLLIFFPLGLFALGQVQADRRVTLYFLIASAALYLCVFSPVSPKTRFHIFEWGIGAVVVAVGFGFTQRRRAWIAYTGFAVFMSLFAIGTVDTCRHFYSFARFLRLHG